MKKESHGGENNVNGPVKTARSEKFRSASLAENLGDALGRLVPVAPARPLLKAAYHGLMNLKTGGRGLACSLPGGEQVRIAPAFRYVSWNMDEYDAFRKALAPGQVALDVGANVGCYSLLFGMWVGKTGRVFAFEPAPQTFAGLRKHIALNHLEEVVKPVQAAVSDSADGADFLLLEHGGMSRLALVEGSSDRAKKVRVRTTTIDKFCETEKLSPDLIKIDVEGFELMVLRGARETIKRGGAALQLFVEMHPTTWRELGLSKDEIVAELDRQGLRAITLSERDADAWTVEGECMRIVPKE